jgi:hypothetical protein
MARLSKNRSFIPLVLKYSASSVSKYNKSPQASQPESKLLEIDSVGTGLAPLWDTACPYRRTIRIQIPEIIIIHYPSKAIAVWFLSTGGF